MQCFAVVIEQREIHVVFAGELPAAMSAKPTRRHSVRQSRPPWWMLATHGRKS